MMNITYITIILVIIGCILIGFVLIYRSYVIEWHYKKRIKTYRQDIKGQIMHDDHTVFCENRAYNTRHHFVWDSPEIINKMENMIQNASNNIVDKMRVEFMEELKKALIIERDLREIAEAKERRLREEIAVQEKERQKEEKRKELRRWCISLSVSILGVVIAFILWSLGK